MDQVFGSDATGGEVKHADWVGPVRLAIGFLTGLGVWLIFEAAKVPVLTDAQVAHHVTALSWAQTHPFVFAALFPLVFFLPMILIAEMGRMRPGRLAVYVGLAGAVLGTMAIYSVWRIPELTLESGALRISDTFPKPWPAMPFLLAASVCLFIVNQLLEHRERGYRLFSEYADYFEVSWMRGAQLILAMGFAVLVTLVLNLGGALFGLIRIGWFLELVQKPWFAIPAFGLAFAAAVHITDVRPALLRGARNLGLTLLSWITPLMTLIAGGFLVALLFTGLAPLWATKHSATLLLNADVLMLLALNAAYKDGAPQSQPPQAVRWAGRGLAVVMLAFAVIAAYAIYLRVNQYGWTQQRVHASALNVILLVYAMGYVWAAVRSARWMQEIERVNVAASLGVLAIAFALFTPIADPDRVAVDSQVARLARHTVKPEQFDFQMLRFESGRFGAEALNRLTRSDRPDVRDRALRAASLTERRFADADEAAPNVTDPPLSHAVIFPKGATLPKDFLAHSRDDAGRDCLTNGAHCEIYVLTRPNATDPVIIVNSTPEAKSGVFGAVDIWTKEDDADWKRQQGTELTICPAALAALRAGQYAIEPSKVQDLVVAGLRVPLGFAPASSCQSPPYKIKLIREVTR